MKRFAMLMAVAAVLMSATAWAYSEDGERGRRRGRRGPPEEAVTACEDKTEGEACAFTVPRRDIEGTCESMRRSEEVACVPEGRGRDNSNAEE
jgi:hypothetical protein